MASLANVSNKTGELSNLYREYHLGFEALRKEVTQPLSETEMEALDEAARKAVNSVFQRLKAQLAAIAAAFAPSLPNPQADVSTLFREVVWIRSELGKAASGQGTRYYRQRAPQFVAQIQRINHRVYELLTVHREMMPLKRTLSVEQQSQAQVLASELDAKEEAEWEQIKIKERAEMPAAIEALKKQIQELKTTRQQAFQSLQKTGTETMNESLNLEIDSLNLSKDEKIALYFRLQKIRRFRHTLEECLPPQTLIVYPESGTLLDKAPQLEALISKAASSCNAINRLGDNLVIKQTELDRLERICSNMAFAEEKR